WRDYRRDLRRLPALSLRSQEVTTACVPRGRMPRPLYSAGVRRRVWRRSLAGNEREGNEMTRKRLTIALSAAILAATGYVGLVGSLGSARADDVQAVIDTRRATMKDMGNQMKAIYAVVDAKSGDLADMQKRALKVQEDAAKIPTLF